MESLKQALKDLLKKLVHELLIDPDIPIVPEVIEGPLDEALEKGLNGLIDRLFA